jgi:ribonuclease HI
MNYGQYLDKKYYNGFSENRNKSNKKNKKKKKTPQLSSFEKLKNEINNKVPNTKKVIVNESFQNKKSEKTFYVIEKGRTTGVVTNPLLIQYAITDFKGAHYKKFNTSQKAAAYFKSINNENAFKKFYYDSKQLLIENGVDTFFYVDGSISLTNSLFSSGFVLEKNGEYVKEQSFTFNTNRVENNELYISEFYAAMLAVIEAQKRGLTHFAIVYDYEQILLSTLRSSTTSRLQRLYYEWMKRETAGMKIEFLKVKSHKNIKGNNRVDELVKTAILYPRKVY